jgi:hypothetical protein
LFEHVSLGRRLLLVGQVVDHEKGAGHLVAQHRPLKSVFVNVFVEAEGGRRLLPQDGGAEGVAVPRRRVRLRPRVHEIFEQTERLQRQRPAKSDPILQKKIMTLRRILFSQIQASQR